MEPSIAATRSWTMRLNLSHWPRRTPFSIPTGWLRLKWMLPSPKWPKAQTRIPGSAASQARLAGPGRRDLDQGVGFVVAREGPDRAADVLQHDLQPEAGHVLEGGERLAGGGS